MKQEDIEKAAKHYQEKDHDIWTDKGITTELQKKPLKLVQSGVLIRCGIL